MAQQSPDPLTNRELVLASLADAPSRLTAPLHSDDSARMIDALRALGVGIELVPGSGSYGDDIEVTPVWPLRGDTEVNSTTTAAAYVKKAGVLTPGKTYRISIDGEILARTPATVAVASKAIEVVVPAEH